MDPPDHAAVSTVDGKPRSDVQHLDVPTDPARWPDRTPPRYLASFILELERCRTAFPPPRSRPDGMIPLVGSSAVIAALRERITRAAATNFTVMIEGGIDPPCTLLNPQVCLLLNTKTARWRERG